MNSFQLTVHGNIVAATIANYRQYMIVECSANIGAAIVDFGIVLPVSLRPDCTDDDICHYVVAGHWPGELPNKDLPSVRYQWRYLCESMPDNQRYLVFRSGNSQYGQKFQRPFIAELVREIYPSMV